MRKNATTDKGLWYRLDHKARVRLVTLGSLFYKQEALADILETTSGTIAGFRHRNGIPMPDLKRPTTNRRFGEFTGLLERLKNLPREPERAPDVVPSPTPSLEVITNPTPPPRKLSPEEEDEKRAQMLINLILGRWKPEGRRRPFNGLNPLRQRVVRSQRDRLIDIRRGIRTLKF